MGKNNSIAKRRKQATIADFLAQTLSNNSGNHFNEQHRQVKTFNIAESIADDAVVLNDESEKCVFDDQSILPESGQNGDSTELVGI